MPTRQADADWTGDLKAGKGEMHMASGAYKGPYSFSSRMENGTGTNPEELLAAAHAGCFSMALSAGLSKAGHVPTRIHTTSKVTFEALPAGGFGITKIDLSTEAVVPGIDEAKFKEIATATKSGCPVSKALAAVPQMNLVAKLLPS